MLQTLPILHLKILEWKTTKFATLQNNQDPIQSHLHSSSVRICNYIKKISTLIMHALAPCIYSRKTCHSNLKYQSSIILKNEIIHLCGVQTIWVLKDHRFKFHFQFPTPLICSRCWPSIFTSLLHILSHDDLAGCAEKPYHLVILLFVVSHFCFHFLIVLVWTLLIIIFLFCFAEFQIIHQLPS